MILWYGNNRYAKFLGQTRCIMVYVKMVNAWVLSRNQPILRFDVILQHDWPTEQCPLHIRVLYGGKTKRPCFDLLIPWLIKQIMNTYQKYFLRSYENRSNIIYCFHWYACAEMDRRAIRKFPRFSSRDLCITIELSIYTP